MRSTRLAVLTTCFSTLVLTACGGGGGTDSSASTPAATPTPTPATPPASDAPAVRTAGVVEGFGSVVVNGTRFSTLDSALSDEDGRTLAADALDLGQNVVVDGTVNPDGTGRAERVTIRRALQGFITARSATQIEALGQVITLSPETVIEGENDQLLQVSDLAVGDYVEVYGLRSGDGQLAATRIEREVPEPNDSFLLEVRGLVSALT